MFVRNGIWWLVVPHFSLIENKAGLFSLLESLTVTREDLNIRPHQCQFILFLSRIWPRSSNFFPKALITGLNYTCLYLLLCSCTGTFFTPIIHHFTVICLGKPVCQINSSQPKTKKVLNCTILLEDILSWEGLGKMGPHFTGSLFTKKTITGKNEGSDSKSESRLG